ncbi:MULTISPECIES: radical SAM family heme chaperone HemW [unclassified Breznakia]|uniref:radical SAM family heme chaperone HemW n=1 Tax=unclassified Breznakia TaxID=2623764 RepID=UPI002473693E|nr:MULTISPECIES: radical SAM family heme chaperone HemW [unclassified Breznakia]MDH6368054.1 oxygen-independent coproporphyrinogen-3 oxidase [Breznakia sp. PH1-1]MDH6405142.1 oxygen-independent coproporphyrinogen-3 oxidase [Breznakia sp. PF1-11]MDH6412869.1 oxygen-independent coproporphyrinogen-3 oxidase [Breznakia sp. PFB1-11]MDH6415218.1 oxygen-independent coproporphyrinogen-3 oxidase [Breznakia sp. PFB1-14]MDH6417540.1 oxygen-independent coproporphyrinogen-3 oxidase [Breznakia sp. PFB1-4]
MINALYIHIPFCENICYYCDFKRSVYNQEVVDAFLSQLEKEMTARVQNKMLHTIYIGGGTPTCLHEAQLERLLHIVEPYTHTVAEYTMESNLESISKAKLELMQAHGVNRVSLGVQSYNDDLLMYMNRKHKAADIDSTIDTIASYIPNISIDLIYGFENQSKEIWLDSLEKATSNLNVKHISIYSLTIEDNSVFGKRGVKLIDSDLEADMYILGREYLKAHGFEHYEIANYARSGYESKHNQVYWAYEDFYGVGLGASGKDGHLRYAITGTMDAYINDGDTLFEEHLSDKDVLVEYLMMNLRTKTGIDKAKFKEIFHRSFDDLFDDVIERLVLYRRAIQSPTHFAMSEEGMLLLHTHLVQFMKVIDIIMEDEQDV